jgi:quinol monooxygenase YgiN
LAASMSAMTRIEVVARMSVRAGMLERFKAQAVECLRLAASRDLGTLAYDWFLSRDGRRCEVRELYADSESLLQHRANVRDAIERLTEDFADEYAITAFGEPSPQLVRLSDALGAGVTWFSLFRGLSGVPAPPD